MSPVSLKKLEGAVIKPGLEKHLVPLTRYKGGLNLGRAHRLVNLLVAAMEQDCNLPDITQRLQRNPEFSHLCGPDKAIQNLGLYGFLSRLEDNPKATQNIPYLFDYVRGLGGHRFELQRISEAQIRARNSNRGSTAKSTPLLYPFLIHDAGRPEHDLLKKVNAAVPKGLSPDLRADICQDLIVGILCGDFSEDDLALPAKEMTRRIYKMFPTKYGPVSLDATLGSSDLRIIDTLTDEDSLWAHI
jgi:hypothetical protein